VVDLEKDEPATVQLRPSFLQQRADALVKPSSPSIAASTTLVTPDQTLADVEARRVQGLMYGLCTSSFVTMWIVLLLGGDPWAGRVHAAALGVSSLLSGACALWFRDPRRFRANIALWVISMQIGVLVTGYYFWGVFSAYGMLVPVTLYIAAGVATRLQAAIGLTVCVLAQTSLAVAVTLGWIESRSLVEPVAERVGLFTELVSIALMQGITIGAALAGAAARRASGEVLSAHHRALRELAQREAQLAEAKADAEAVREAAVGGPGRYSEQTLGSFKLGVILGRGAMGEIYAAERVADGTPVAVKVLAAHLTRDPMAVERFMRETEIVSALDSPHIVRVLEVSPREAAVPYIAMERLDGTDLATQIKREPVRPLNEIVELVEQVGAGLEAAHEAGVIHRDLKPANLFATTGPRGRLWKILDFGTARRDDSEGSLTEGHLVGTPGYMSPEQARGAAVDGRSDVYTLGVLVYRLLTGVPAVVPADVPAMLLEVTYRMPAAPSRNATVSRELEAVLAIALAKNPDDRFATATEFAAAFVEAAAGRRDPRIKDRAAKILARTPWGAWVSR
jgi:tRNA A-37 threonylcarbamoyl transferase component Bud32